MQTLVNDIDCFDGYIHTLEQIILEVENNCKVNTSTLSSKEEESKLELSISDSMLQSAKQEESSREMEYMNAFAKNAQADMEVSAAISSNNPAAIASATAYAVDTFRELQAASTRKEEATSYRQKMDKKVELANANLHNIIKFIDEIKMNFNQKINNLINSSDYGTARLQEAKNILISYHNYSNALGNLNLTKQDLNKKYIEKILAYKITYINSQHAGKVHNGIMFSKYGFPIFDPTFEAKITHEHFNKSRGSHDLIANKYLKKSLQDTPELNKIFSNRQLQQIELNATPDGYTWHHDANPPPGNIQLVKTDIHNAIGHTGGFKTWASIR